MWLELVGLIVPLILIFSVIRKFKRPKNFPPGPSGFFSNLSGFASNPLRTLMLWKEKYGAVVGCRVGEFRVVVLNDPSHIRKAFSSDAINSRPPFLPAMLYVGGLNHGTLTSSAEVWRAVRDCMVRNMSRLHTSPIPGVGDKEALLTLSQDMKPLLEKIKFYSMSNPRGKLALAELRRKLYIPMANLVWHSLTGEQLPEEAKMGLEQKFMDLQKAIWQPIGSPVWFLPTLAKRLPSTQKILKEIETALRPVHEIVEQMVKKVELEKDGNSFVRAFFTGCSSSPCLKGNEANHLKGTFFVLWHTAVESVGNLLAWTLLWLSLYPEVQDKLVQELAQQSDTQGEENINLTGLSYTRAVIQESLRLSSTAPFANFHWSVEDYTLPNGMVIPKESIVIGNLFGVHHDPAVWDDAEIFRPERFLPFEDDEGENDEKKERLRKSYTLPFSTGLRACPGQNFAKNCILYALPTVLKEYKFSWDDQHEAKPTPEEILEKSLVSIFRFVPNYELVVSKRNGRIE